MNDKIKVLFLAANPKDSMSPLRLGEEFQGIVDKIRSSPQRDEIDLAAEWSLTPDVLQEALLRHQPHILHFSGHGTKDKNKGIALEDISGNTSLVDKAAFAELLKLLKDNIRIVVLNACHTKSQAKLLTDTFDFVIGMNLPIGDAAACIFAAYFYQGLAYGRSVQLAFDLALSQMKIKDIEHSGLPELLVRRGVDASKTILVEKKIKEEKVPEKKERIGPKNIEIKGEIHNQGTTTINGEQIGQSTTLNFGSGK